MGEGFQSALQLRGLFEFEHFAAMYVGRCGFQSALQLRGLFESNELNSRRTSGFNPLFSYAVFLRPCSDHLHLRKKFQSALQLRGLFEWTKRFKGKRLFVSIRSSVTRSF